jgi:hypothetical protein
MASPATYNMIVPQATTFQFAGIIKEDSTPWNLTNYTATMTVRPFLGATTTTLVASTANGKITLGGVTGSITINLSAVDTAIPAEPYVYDLVLNSGSVITRVLEGQFIVTAGVTV